MVHQWVFTNARQKLTSRHVWQGDVSGYRSLCNDYFGRGPQFIDLFDVFMAQFFSCGVCTEEERFWQKLIFQDDNSSLIALPDEMTTLKLVASASQKIWKIEVYVLGKSYEWPYSSFLNGGRLKGLTDCAGIRAGDCGTLQSWWTKR